MSLKKEKSKREIVEMSKKLAYSKFNQKSVAAALDIIRSTKKK